jgi:hypothetical protein
MKPTVPPFLFQKRAELFVGMHDKTPSLAAMCVSNPDRSPVGINRRDATPTPTGFAEVVSNGFPVFHRHGCCLLIVQDGLRCGFAQFNLCTHFLQSRSKRLNLLLLLDNGRFQFVLYHALLFEQLICRER